MDEKYWTNLENLFVHYVYDEISPCKEDDNDEDNSIKSSNNNNNNNNNRAWKKVKNFINELEPNSLLLDVGCGNGKYLEINNSIYTVGCDICKNLVNIAGDNQSSSKNQLLICDNLKLPFRSDLFDAVISIGVIHHFSTQNRRSNAIKELCRILKPGGKLMIYVWAYEQISRKFESQDILVPSLVENNIKINNNKRNRRKFKTKTKLKLFMTTYLNKDLSERITHAPSNNKNNKSKERYSHSFSIDSDDSLKPLKLTTSSQQQTSIMSTITKFFSDKLVVKNLSHEKLSVVDYYNRLLKDDKSLPEDFQIRQFPMSSCENTFKDKNEEEEEVEENVCVNDHLRRYYHVFKANELDMLIKDSCNDLVIYTSYYDHGNWCVCAEKR